MNKDQLRQKIKIKRKYFGEIVRLEADRAIAETFLQAFGSYQSFFIYNSFGYEASTHRIIAALLAEGKTVCLPRVEGQNMVAVPVTARTEYKKSSFGIWEPCGEVCGEPAQVVAVPLLAVNSRGYRIGYGGGYYDRYLRGLNALKVGMGYDFQIEEFNEDAHDVPLDIYLSERGIYTFEK